MVGAVGRDEVALREKLATELVDSGRYHELQQLVRQQLAKEDWYAKVEKLVESTISQKTSTGFTPSLVQVMSTIETDAIDLVSSQAREEIYASSHKNLNAIMATMQEK